MMRRWRLFLLLIFAPLGVSTMAQTSDLEGAWVAFAAERDGAAADELVGHRIEFTGDHFSITKAGSVIFAGRVAVAPETVPAAIDFTIEEGEAKGQSWQGIYRIENATLTICDNAPDRQAKRPSDFAAPKGSGYVCLQFRR
jgi:uncharacterized protein (TIGR03067 family)